MEDEGGTDVDDLASVTERDGKDQPARGGPPLLTQPHLLQQAIANKKSWFGHFVDFLINFSRFNAMQY